MCKDCVEFDGRRWHVYGDAGYYEFRGTRSLRYADRDRLHRAVWRKANGPIPPGYDIHHRDENRRHNDLDNLVCLPHGDHKALHLASTPIPRLDWSTRPAVDIACSGCGVAVQRKRRNAKPTCAKCASKRAEAARQSQRSCIRCGAGFISRRGQFCSQRCVNLGARWGTAGIQPSG